jgi:hypothetical protein
MDDKSAQNECVKRWAVFFDCLELSRENNRESFNIDEMDRTPAFYIKDWDSFVGVDSSTTPEDEAMQHYQLISSISGRRAIYICGFPSPDNYKAFVFSRDKEAEALEEDDSVPTTHVLITEGEFRQCRRCPNIIFAGDFEEGESTLSFGLGHKHARKDCNACGDYEPIIGDSIERAYQAAASAASTGAPSASTIPVGNYHVIVEGAHGTRDRTTKTDDQSRGEPMIVWNLKIVGSEYNGHHLRRKQNINSTTYKQMIADLHLCGVHCDAGDILANLPRTHGVELDIIIDGAAGRTISFNRRLDTKSQDERGVSTEVQHFPDIAAEFGELTGAPEKLHDRAKPMNRAELQSATEKLADKLMEKTNESGSTPIFQVFSSEDWDCHDSLLNELDPTFIMLDDDKEQ